MLKLNVGFTKKVGEANYGSRGASVNLELELDSVLVGEPDRLKDRIRQLFDLAKVSVDTELIGSATPTDRNGHTGEHRNGHGNGRRRDNTRKATASQARALHAIADRTGIDLAAKLQTDFGIHDPEQLTITEASQLIAALNGNGHEQRSGGDR